MILGIILGILARISTCIFIVNICYIVSDPDRLHWWILVRAKATLEEWVYVNVPYMYGSLPHRHHKDTSESLERKPQPLILVG